MNVAGSGTAKGVPEITWKFEKTASAVPEVQAVPSVLSLRKKKDVSNSPPFQLFWMLSKVTVPSGVSSPLVLTPSVTSPVAFWYEAMSRPVF